MQCLCNFLPFQIPLFNCVYASFAQSPHGKQPMVVLLFPKGQTSHRCSSWATSSSQQLPSTYRMSVMFSSYGAQRACCSAKRNPRGKESAWMAAHYMQGSRAPPLYCNIAKFPLKKRMQISAESPIRPSHAGEPLISCLLNIRKVILRSSRMC